MGVGRALYVLRVLGLIGRIPYHIMQILAALLGGGARGRGSTKAVAAGVGALAGLASTLRSKGSVSSGSRPTSSPSESDHAEPFEDRARRAHDLLVVAVRWFELGMHDKAIEACLEAVQLNPQFSDAWGFLGNQYVAAGKLDEALRALSETLRLNPRDGIAWADLGDAYLRKGEPKLAVQALEEALRLKPPRDVAKMSRIWKSRLCEAKRACSGA